MVCQVALNKHSASLLTRHVLQQNPVQSHSPGFALSKIMQQACSEEVVKQLQMYWDCAGTMKATGSAVVIMQTAGQIIQVLAS